MGRLKAMKMSNRNQYHAPISTELRNLRSVTDVAFENTGIDVGAVDICLPRRTRMKTSLEFPSLDDTSYVTPALSAAAGRLLLVVDFDPIERPDNIYRTDRLPGIAGKLVPASFRFQRNELYDVEPLAGGRLAGSDERQTHAYTAATILGVIRSVINSSSELEFFQARHPKDQEEYLRFGQRVIVDSLRFEGKLGFGAEKDLKVINAELQREAYPPIS